MAKDSTLHRGSKQARLAPSLLVLLSLLTLAHAETADEQLWNALEKGNADEVQNAIRAGARVADSRQDLVARALGSRQSGVVELLLANGAKVTGEQNGGVIFSAIGIREVPLALIEKLHRAGAPLDWRNLQGGLVLQAIRLDRDEIALWLLAQHAPVNLVDEAGTTELMSVARREAVDDATLLVLAQALLRAGADPQRKDSKGKTAADEAVERGYRQVLELLEPNGARQDSKTLRQTGLNHGLAIALRWHAQSQMNWSAPRPDQPKNQAAVIKRLLREGADPNAQFKSWRASLSMLEMGMLIESSPVMWVADPEVLKLLLDAGARWESCGDRLPEVLYRVAADPKILRVALDHGLPPNSDTTRVGMSLRLQRRATTMSLLHAACDVGALESIKLLLQHRAGLNTRDQEGYTPLMRAVASGSDPAVELMLNAGAMPNQDDGAPQLVDLAARAGLISRVRAWDKQGVYRELTWQFPPQPGNRWLGEWVSESGSMAGKLIFNADGMGLWLGRTAAWAETEDGIRVRFMGRNPKLPDIMTAQEIRLASTADGRLQVTGSSAGYFPGGGGEPVIFHRPGAATAAQPLSRSTVDAEKY